MSDAPYQRAAEMAAAKRSPYPFLAPPDAAHPNELGVLDGRYRVFGPQPLGRGASAVVFKGRSNESEVPLAIKVAWRDLSGAVPPGPLPDAVAVANLEAERKYLEEIHTQANGKDCKVVRLVGGGRCVPPAYPRCEVAYYVMEYVGGVLLRDRLNGPPVRRLAPAEALRVARDLATALVAVHAAGVVHQDVKPENVLVRVAADGAAVADAVLIDFDVAFGASGARPVAFSGVYASPEQRNKRGVDHRTDLYSFGATLFAALTGTEPKPDQGKQNRRLAEAGRSLADADHRTWDRLAGVCARCLQPDPANRYQTAEDVLKALTGLDVPPTPPPPIPANRKWLTAVLAAVVLVVAVVGLTRAFTGGQDTPASTRQDTPATPVVVVVQGGPLTEKQIQEVAAKVAPLIRNPSAESKPLTPPARRPGEDRALEDRRQRAKDAYAALMSDDPQRALERLNPSDVKKWAAEAVAPGEDEFNENSIVGMTLAGYYADTRRAEALEHLTIAHTIKPFDVPVLGNLYLLDTASLHAPDQGERRKVWIDKWTAVITHLQGQPGTDADYHARLCEAYGNRGFTRLQADFDARVSDLRRAVAEYHKTAAASGPTGGPHIDNLLIFHWVWLADTYWVAGKYTEAVDEYGGAVAELGKHVGLPLDQFRKLAECMTVPLEAIAEKAAGATRTRAGEHLAHGFAHLAWKAHGHNDVAGLSGATNYGLNALDKYAVPKPRGLHLWLKCLALMWKQWVPVGIAPTAPDREKSVRAAVSTCLKDARECLELVDLLDPKASAAGHLRAADQALGTAGVAFDPKLGRLLAVTQSPVKFPVPQDAVPACRKLVSARLNALCYFLSRAVGEDATIAAAHAKHALADVAEAARLSTDPQIAELRKQMEQALPR